MPHHAKRYKTDICAREGVALLLAVPATEFSPHDPLRCGLNSTTSYTRCFVLTGAVRQFPRGFSTGVALQLQAWRSPHFCGHHFFLKFYTSPSGTGCREWNDLCASDESFQADETVVGGSTFVLARALLCFRWPCQRLSFRPMTPCDVA